MDFASTKGRRDGFPIELRFEEPARPAGGLRVPGTWGTHLAREVHLTPFRTGTSVQNGPREPISLRAWQWKSQFEVEQHKWADYFTEFGFSIYYPRTYIYKIREALHMTCHKGEQPPSYKVQHRLQQVLNNDALFARVWTSVNKLPAIVETSSDKEKEKDGTRTRQARAAVTAKDMEIENQVFGILHKRVQFLWPAESARERGDRETVDIKTDQL